MAERWPAYSGRAFALARLDTVMVLPGLMGFGLVVNLKRVLWHLLGGTRGGPLRIRILRALEDRPYNTNQLAEHLGVDYKTIQHHIRVLVENRILEPQGAGYGTVYFFSKDMEESLEEFHAIWGRLREDR